MFASKRKDIRHLFTAALCRIGHTNSQTCVIGSAMSELLWLLGGQRVRVRVRVRVKTVQVSKHSAHFYGHGNPNIWSDFREMRKCIMAHPTKYL